MTAYTWDPDKARTNLIKHGVSFEEGMTVMDSPLARWSIDPRPSFREDRFWVVGPSDQGRLLLVVTSEGGPRPRIISAWRATKRERREYEDR